MCFEYVSPNQRLLNIGIGTPQCPRQLKPRIGQMSIYAKDVKDFAADILRFQLKPLKIGTIMTT